jgi:hypothetical protein
MPRVNTYYAKVLAETLLSTCSFNFKVRVTESWTTLTTWNLVILPSGDWKTVSILQWYMPIIDKVEEKLGYEKQLVISRFSDEGLIKHMTWHEKSFYDVKEKKCTVMTIGDKGAIVRDEFTGLIKGIRAKDYLSETLELLSEVYDGRILRRDTISHGEQNVSNCVKSFLSATTPYIYTLPVTGNIWQGGFPRMNPLVIEDEFDENSDPKDTRLSDDFGNQDYEQNPLIQETADKLYNVIKSPLQKITLDEKAKELWLDYENKYYRAKKNLNKFDKSRGFYARQAEKVLKLSGLYVVSRLIHIVVSKNCTNNLVVTEQDVELAIKNQEFALENWKQMLNGFDCAPEPDQRMPDDTKIRRKILAMINQYKIIPKPKLADELGLNDTNKKFNETIESLLLENKIEQIGGMQHGEDKKEDSRQLIYNADAKWLREREVNPKPRGNPPVFYKLPWQNQ